MTVMDLRLISGMKVNLKLSHFQMELDKMTAIHQASSKTVRPWKYLKLYLIKCQSAKVLKQVFYQEYKLYDFV